MDCNVADFGACTKDVLQTDIFQKAIDACFLSGGGTVCVPEGIYRIGSIRLRSGVTLYLCSGAILEGSRDPEDYCTFKQEQLEPFAKSDMEGTVRCMVPLSRWNNGLIRAFNAENISIVGEKYSYIDGMNCYDPQGEEGYRGPHLINMWNCKNIKLSGYTLRNSGNWAHAIFKSTHVVAENLTVLGGHDGLDVIGCDEVTIRDCCFRSGDDGIAGFDNCNVDIRNCYLNSSCNGLRFGGNHVRIEGCEIVGPGSFGHRYGLSEEEKRMSLMTDKESRRNMERGFLYYCDFRTEVRKTPGDIVVKNCRFENPGTLFALPFEEQWCCNRSLSSITFEECTVSGMEVPIYISGSEAEPTAFILKNVKISCSADYKGEVFIDAKNCSEICLDSVSVKNPKKMAIRIEGKEYPFETGCNISMQWQNHSLVSVEGEV